MIGARVVEKLANDSLSKSSKLILALDTSNICGRKADINEAFEFTRFILDSARDYTVALKIGYPLILKLGLELVSEIIEDFDGIAIADVKLADIDNTNKLITEELMDAGFKAVIAHAFQGKDTLEPLLDPLESKDSALFIVASMSNPGAERTFKSILDYLIDVGLDLDVTGFIAPATRPQEIKYIREKVGRSRLILSPGVGAQGGKIEETIKAGADYIIVGRSIYCAEDPRIAAMDIAKKSYT